MGFVSTFFTYAKLAVLLVGRMMAKLLQMGTSRFSRTISHLLSTSQVNLPNGDKQLLGTEDVHEAVQKDLADEWVAVSDEDNWEPGGRDLLDKNEKRSRHVSESSTEDELIELSDGEERTAMLQSAKRTTVTSPPSKPAELDTSGPTTTVQ